MADEQKQLFRQKSVDMIQSPESLNEYLKVTSPGVWILLLVVIVLLIGVAVWGFLGHIDAETQVVVVADEEEAYCLVPEAAIQAVINNKTVTIQGQDYVLSPDTLEPTVISSETTNVYVLLAGQLSDGDVVYKVSLEGELSPDIYEGSIVTESISPASFLFN